MTVDKEENREQRIRRGIIKNGSIYFASVFYLGEKIFQIFSKTKLGFSLRGAEH